MTASDRKRILFVDDEPAILAGLRHLLFRERASWDMVFATGGEAALARSREQPFDVVISDMRMPGMDGAELLTAIMHESPSTARIVLSGQAERAAVLRALPASHQLLSKPCDAATLRRAIERGLRLKTLPPDVVALIGRLDKLPSPARAFYDLTDVMSAPRATAQDMLTIIEREPAMCVKILQLVNSAYFGAGRDIVSIGRAISLLGTEPLKYLTLTSSVFATLPSDPFEGFSIAGMQECALQATQLVRKMLPGNDTAFAATLLHDMGRTALAITATEAYRAVVERAAGDDLLAVEHAMLGVTHPEVGACVLDLWGIPRDVCELVRWHHEPWGAPAHLRDAAAAVYTADREVDRVHRRELDDPQLEASGLAARVAEYRSRLS